MSANAGGPNPVSSGISSLSRRNEQARSTSGSAKCPTDSDEANLADGWGFSVVADPGTPLEKDKRNEMSTLKRILRELTQEIERLSQRNEVLERRLTSITGALQGAVRVPRNGSGRMNRRTRRAGRRGAPPKFGDAQAMQLRREYEKGATSAQLARKYKAALPTILGTLRRAGTSLRRGRPPKRK